jgi:adenine-specific DNA glycosylase
VKLRKTEPVQLEGVLLVVRNRGRVLLRQRDRLSSRMPGFWDLPTPEELPGAEIGERIGAIRHTITHHHYALEVRHASSKAPRDAAFRWFTAAEMSAIPFSTTARKALYLAGFVPKL